MTQESYPLSDLDSLLFTDNITEDDLLQLPELSLEESKNSPSETPLIHESENLPITPTDKPTISVNDRPRKRRSTIPPPKKKQLLQRQKRNEEATSK